MAWLTINTRCGLFYVRTYAFLLYFYNPLFFFLNMLLDPWRPLLWLCVHLFYVTAFMDMALWGQMLKPQGLSSTGELRSVCFLR